MEGLPEITSVNASATPNKTYDCQAHSAVGHVLFCLSSVLVFCGVFLCVLLCFSFFFSSNYFNLLEEK